jgi:hypothetical protein
MVDHLAQQSADETVAPLDASWVDLTGEEKESSLAASWAAMTAYAMESQMVEQKVEYSA